MNNSSMSGILRGAATGASRLGRTPDDQKICLVSKLTDQIDRPEALQWPTQHTCIMDARRP